MWKMFLKRVILNLILMAVATKWLVEGLQCYVCDDCNESEDFKELHICGEIVMTTTTKPLTSSGINDSNSGNQITINSTVELSAKPSVKPLNEDNRHSYNKNTSQSQTTITKSEAEEPIVTTTLKPTTQKSIFLTNSPVSENQTTTTHTQTQSTAINIQPESTKEAGREINSTNTSALVTTIKPMIPEDYDDYLDYEDPIKTDTQSFKSLLKVHEPVCYMIKYHVNGTISTKRGCTTFINANKYLTCQSLFNGHPMSSCRICSANGCNKFLNDTGAIDNDGILLNSSGVPKYHGVVVMLLWLLLNRFLNIL